MSHSERPRPRRFPDNSRKNAVQSVAKGNIELIVIPPLATAALIGGLGGATFAEKRLSARALQRVFAVIILIAAIKAAYDVISS